MNDEGRLHSAPATINYSRSHGTTRVGVICPCGEPLTAYQIGAGFSRCDDCSRQRAIRQRDERLRRQPRPTVPTDPRPLVRCLLELAYEAGSLRRVAEPESKIDNLAKRIGDRIEDAVLMVEPTAAELVAQYAPGDDAAVTEALRNVDARWRTLRRLLAREAA